MKQFDVERLDWGLGSGEGQGKRKATQPHSPLLTLGGQVLGS